MFAFGTQSRRLRGAGVARAVATGIVFGLVVTSCAPSAVRLQPTLAPDLGKRLIATHGVVTSAQPLASEAGLEILREGGNAVDAAVATAFAIGVVEPEMSGLGGGGAMLVWQQAKHRADYVDFYSSQPVAAFAAAHITTRDTMAPLRGTAVPGEVAGLLAAHERFGRLTRAQVMAPAIRIAEQGYPLYQILAEMIDMDSTRMRSDPIARSLFWSSGHLATPGDRIVNPTLAATLRRVAAEGRNGFYEGPTARAVVERMNAGGHPVRLQDFSGYEPVWRRPLCTVYRGNVILSAPPPQGGMQMVSSLKLLEPYDMKSIGYPTKSAQAFDVFVSAMRVAQRGPLGSDDPRWTSVPARGAISDGYAESRRAEVGNGHPVDSMPPGRPQAYDAAPSPAACAQYDPYPQAPSVAVRADDATTHPAGGETTHIAVVDADGNAVSVTVTNSSVFGNRAGVLGFFLNDSGIPYFKADELARNNAPLWHTRISTIAPTVVLNDNRVRMVVGSPGGGRIPLAMMQDISYVLDYGLDPLASLRMPRMYPVQRSLRVELEGEFDPTVLFAARNMGYEPTAQSFGYARLYMIVRDGDQWIGVADPRHDGQVRGY